MKEGTGGDPFADDDPAPEPTDSEPTTTMETDTETEPASSTQSSTQSNLPYIYQRDTVKEDRDQVPFFLRPHVQDLEDDFIDQLEDRLGRNVYKADAREAALLTAYNNYIDEVAELLDEWGYSI